MQPTTTERTAPWPTRAAKYTDEFRREIADYIISTGRLVAECCSELGLNSKTVNSWVQKRRRELAGEPDPGAEGRESREARKRIRELGMENAFPKKAAAFFAKEQGGRALPADAGGEGRIPDQADGADPGRGHARPLLVAVQRLPAGRLVRRARGRAPRVAGV